MVKFDKERISLEEARVLLADGDVRKRLAGRIFSGLQREAEDLVGDAIADALETVRRACEHSEDRKISRTDVFLLAWRAVGHRASEAWRRLECEQRSRQELRVVAAPVPDPESLYSFAETRSLLRHHVDRLPENWREALLRDLDGVSQAEIARRLGVARATVGSWIHRARAQLKRWLLAADPL